MSDSFDQVNNDPVEMLREMIKKTLTYLIEHPNVSRVSILKDLQTGQPNDNMQSSINAYDKLLLHFIHDERQRFLAGHIFAASVQSFFMRSDVLYQTQNMDIMKSDVRSRFVDDLIDMILRGVQYEEEDIN